MDQAGTVDPELQSSISNLVSALGGPDPATQKYKLGDEALACLRDLRKWIQLYDANSERLDVACAIGNTTLVHVDLPEILALWESSALAEEDPYMDRVALGCLELLVPLTWPIEVLGKENTKHYFSQVKFVQQSQARYKRTLLNHSSRSILHAILRLATKSALKKKLEDRDERDEGILTLVCLMFRNLARIDSGDDEDRKDTISQYLRQSVMSFLVLMGSGMGTNFDTQDVVILECLYYLLRGVDQAKLYGVESRDETTRDPFRQNLRDMLDIEDNLNRSVFKPSRHSRFGTMVAMNEGQGEWISISGQRAVTGLDSTLSQIDESKRWHRRATRPVTDDRTTTSYSVSAASINSNPEVIKPLAGFANEFLDAGFNPLIVKLRKLIERQQPRVLKSNLVHYLSLVAWFLEAERLRCEAAEQPIDFGLVGGALSRQAIAVVLMLLRKGLDPGELQSTELVQVAMVALRTILTYVREMGYSQIDEFVDAAESIKSRLFYEETWLNLLAHLPRQAYNKSLIYACESVQLTHIVFKMLDEYSKQHTYMFVKSTRARKKGAALSDEVVDNEEEQAHQEAARVTSERKFSFSKFVAKYIHESTIDTYERVLASYRDLSDEMVLHVFSFFRRTFASTEFKAYFYRLSLMRLLLALVDQRGLPPNSKARTTAEQFLTYYVRKFAITAERMPSLHIQVNEVMNPADAFYYDHQGNDKEVHRPPRFELELKSRAIRDFTAERQFAIIVAALIDRGQDDFVEWTGNSLTDLLLGEAGNEEHRSSSNIPSGTNQTRRKLVTQPLTQDKSRIKTANSDALIRLFLRSLGLVVNTAVGQIIVPSSIDEANAIERLEWIQKYRSEPVEFGQGKEAMSYIKVQGQRDAYDDEDSDEDDQAPVSRAPIYRPTNSPDSFSDDEPLPTPAAEVADAGVENELSKARDISRKRTQSAAFALEDSDDDDNDDVEAQVSSIRRRQRTVDDGDDDD